MLGEGAFCTVYQALDLDTEEVIAVKVSSHISLTRVQVIKRKNLYKDSIELLRQEAELLKSIDHPNIVQFKHVSTFADVTKTDHSRSEK